MHVLIPKKIDLTASNISEPLSLWGNGTTYSSGERVYTYHSDYDEQIQNGDGIIDLMTYSDATFSQANTRWEWDGTQASTDDLVQDVEVTDGGKYLVVFEITSYSAGNATPIVGGTTGSARSATGYYEEIITAGSSDTNAGVQVDADFNGSITNISVKKVSTLPGKKVWVSQGSQSGNYPPVDDATNWVAQSYSNRWKMFDDSSSSQSVSDAANEAIDVTVDSGKCNRLGLFRLQGTSVQVIVKDSSGTELLNETYSLYNPTYSPSYWNYFYGDIGRYSSFTVSIPVGFGTTTQVIINPIDGQKAKCGHMQVAKEEFIGKTKYGFEAGSKSWGKIEESFSEFSLIRGAVTPSKRLDMEVRVLRNNLDPVFQILQSLDLLPVGWDANNDTTSFTTLVTYAFIEKWSIKYEVYPYVYLRIVLQEMP
jgi:hypothetical protein